MDVRASSLVKGTNSTFFLTYVRKELFLTYLRKEQNGPVSTLGYEAVAPMMALAEILQKI